MKSFAIFALLVALVSAESFRPVSKVLTPAKYDIDGKICVSFNLFFSLW